MRLHINLCMCVCMYARRNVTQCNVTGSELRSATKCPFRWGPDPAGWSVSKGSRSVFLAPSVVLEAWGVPRPKNHTFSRNDRCFPNSVSLEGSNGGIKESSICLQRGVWRLHARLHPRLLSVLIRVCSCCWPPSSALNSTRIANPAAPPAAPPAAAPAAVRRDSRLRVHIM